MKRILFSILPLCLSVPLLAQAADGYVVSDISLQAGPDTEYPQITELAAGTPVAIEGCIDGYTWCDVIAGDNRGWVAGSFVQEEYDNQPVIIEDYGPRIGIPIVAFSLGVYWEQHYNSRPFYAQRTQWEGRHISPRQPPRPSAEAIRNSPHFGQRAGGGRPGESQAAQHQPAKPASVQPVTRERAAAHVEPKPAPVNRTDVQHERVQTKPTATTHSAPPRPVAEPKEVTRPTATAHPAPLQKAAQKPKAEPKPEEKKDDGGHKDDSKDH